VLGLADSFAAGLQKYDCRYGSMFALPSDNVISKSLRVYGEWAEHELSILRPFISAGSIVIDVGANIGTHTLPFSRWVRSGRVIAIEAQPAICEVLRLNCRQNGCSNVSVVNAICSDRRGNAEFEADYTDENNFGGVSFAAAPPDARLAVFRWLDRFRHRHATSIPVIPLDDLCRAQVALIKLDIEGMELDALRGAHQLIARHQPVIFFEQNSTARLHETHDYLTGAGYRLFWLETQPFNRSNFRREDDNIWWRTETAILALPAHVSPPSELMPVRGDENTVPLRLNARDGISIPDDALAVGQTNLLVT
jgi:FkbM family methyltransferase